MKNKFGKKKLLLEIVPSMLLIVFEVSFQQTVFYKKIKIIKKRVLKHTVNTFCGNNDVPFIMGNKCIPSSRSCLDGSLEDTGVMVSCHMGIW